MKTVRSIVWLCAVAALLMFSTLANAIEWQDDYGVALDAARLAKKPLLIVLEMPSDRGSDSAEGDLVGSALLKPYELCSVDVSTPVGKRVAEAFSAKEFPYTVITDRDGKNVIYRKAGHQTELDWNSLLMTYRDGKKPAPIATFASEAFIESAQASPEVCFT